MKHEYYNVFDPSERLKRKKQLLSTAKTIFLII